MSFRWGWLAVVLAAVGVSWATPATAEEEFLDPELAFRFSARPLDERAIEVRFDVAPGYYLYREQFKFEATPASLGQPVIPSGKVKYDQTFRKDVETHRGTLLIRLPVEEATGPFRLTVTSQGCADKGLCYPPAQHHADVQLIGFGAARSEVRLIDTAGGTSAPGSVSSLLRGMLGGRAEAGRADDERPPASPADLVNTASPTDLGRIEAALQSGRLPTVIAVFFVAGILLSFTPCVLPMLPILSSLIVGQAETSGQRGPSRARGFALAASYSLGMALVYTLFGIAAGWSGEGLAASLQTPWVLGGFALMLVLLALSMFGFYELQLPAAMRERLAHASSRVRGGKIAGVFVMGGLSALIVSPCVAAPLAGALVYISQTRDVVLGGAALFALALGMSVPLLALGLSSGGWLPRAGAWMERVKHFFGAVLLGVAIWIVQPVLPGPVAMLLWGALLLIGAAYLRVFDSLNSGTRGWGRFGKGAGVVLALLGALEFIGVASGGSDPLQPLKHLVQGSGALDPSAVTFRRVNSVEELDRELVAAGRPVMLDFYADWCVSCKEMEAFTFSDPRVKAKLSQVLLLQADVTRNSEHDKALLKRFQLFGPPGTIFFDPQGRELSGVRVIGFQSADRFLQTLQAAGL